MGNLCPISETVKKIFLQLITNMYPQPSNNGTFPDLIWQDSLVRLQYNNNNNNNKIFIATQ